MYDDINSPTLTADAPMIPVERNPILFINALMSGPEMKYVPMLGKYKYVQNF